MSADGLGFVASLSQRSDICGEGGWVSSEISVSSDEMGPSLTSMATASAVHTLEVTSIRTLTVVFIGGLGWLVETSSDRKMN